LKLRCIRVHIHTWLQGSPNNTHAFWHTQSRRHEPLECTGHHHVCIVFCCHHHTCPQHVPADSEGVQVTPPPPSPSPHTPAHLRSSTSMGLSAMSPAASLSRSGISARPAPATAEAAAPATIGGAASRTPPGAGRPGPEPPAAAAAAEPGGPRCLTGRMPAVSQHEPQLSMSRKLGCSQRQLRCTGHVSIARVFVLLGTVPGGCMNRVAETVGTACLLH
jgi:hypothetical protein